MPPKKSVVKASSKPAATQGKSTVASKKAAIKTQTSSVKGKALPSNASPKKSPSKTQTGLKKAKNDEKSSAKKPAVVSWSKEELAAIKLQKNFRVLLAKKALNRLRIEKANYEEEIERLQREAWLEIVKREREEAEKERLKEEEERKRKKEEAKRKKIILEAAFDGDKQTIENVLAEAKKSDLATLKASGPALELQILRHQLALIECEDANANTALSEAAAGGDCETIEFLIDKGADVNTRGAFRRTPLYRAAFGGHIAAAQALLENGADPRLYADDGNSPEQIAAAADIAEVISTWDIKETERLLNRNEKKKEERLKIEKDHLEKQTKLLSEKILAAEKVYKVKQRQLQKAYEELNKRIFEHDKCALSDPSKNEITIQAVHDGEEDLDNAKKEEKEAREHLSDLKLQLREETSHNKDEIDVFATKGVKCHLKELDDVLMRDVGDKLKSDRRWPLVVDPSGQTSVFLRYRDTNYINALNMKEMEADYLRKALLGALRYGKFLVIDMMQVDMLEVLESRIEEVEKGLFKILMEKELLKSDRFLSLLRKEDGPEYTKEKFATSRIENFKLVILSSMWQLPEHWLDMFYSIKVIVSS